MAKTHELLAVEQQLKGQAEKTRTELRATFSGKQHLFEEKRKVFIPNGEDQKPIVEEQSDIQTNVTDELQWLAGIWSRALDVSYQIAEANTEARADVILDNGTVLLANVPATALLDLEKRAGEFQDLLASVKTLDPAKAFREDDDRPAGIFKAREVRKDRTKKTVQPLTLYPATKEHPAQVKEISVDVVVGTILEQEWSGLITPKLKGEMLERVEEVRRAIKTARMRANDHEVDTKKVQKVGDKLFEYVLGSKS